MNGRVLGRAVIRLAVALLCVNHTALGYGGEEHGPRFVVEPPVSVFFSNATGARVECAAEGTPRPLVRWQTVLDGATVRGVRDLMHVDDNGTLVFSPFAEHQYSPDVHSVAYRCVAHSRAGTIVSRTVQVRAEVIRNFEPIVRDTVTMPGNVAVFNCHIPGVSYNENHVLPESVAITSWVQDGVFNIFPSWEIDSKIIMIPKTGQLRIANVDENDLRHSYTCRIVNKLTGFTQESSTFGRIYFESNRTMAPWSKSNDFTVHLVKQGDHLLLPCDVYGFPPPKVTWSSGTSTVVVTADTSAGGGRSKAPMNFLRLRSVQRTDAGNYTCTARNTVGSKSLQHQVIVTPDMSAHVVPALADIESGRSVSFTCITSAADDNQIVIWLKDGVPRKSSSSTPPTYTLNVDSVQKDDQGMYQCVVTNKLNNEMAHSFAELRLSASKPTLKYKFIGHLLKPGPDVSLKCIAIGTPTPHITWKFDGNDVSLSQMRISVSQYVTEIGDVVSHFNITKVQVEDGGLYECIVSNRAGQVSHSAKIQVYGDPVAKKTPKIIARAGQQLQMTCPISGYPIFNINWEKDSKRLPGGKLLNKRHKVFANGSIVIENVQKKTDQGTYYCEASNDKHVVRASVEVVVIAPPEITPFYFSELTEGSRVQVACTVHQGDLPLNLTWLKDGGPVYRGPGAAAVTPFNAYSTILTMNNVSRSDTGDYTCVAANPVHSATYTAHLNVNVPPEWIIEPKDVNVVRDDQAEVNCSASGHPKPTIKWKKGSSKDSDQFSEDVTDNVTADGTLVISKVTKKHEGYYVCEANNEVGTPIISIIRLNVQDLPHIILPNTKYMSINGGVASMACEATGDQPIHISWIKGSVQLSYKSANLRYNVEEMYTDTSVKSKLIISKVSATDSGRYVCVAENSLGKHEAAMELEIKVLGSPPDDLSCNVTTPNSVRLRWTDLNSNNLMNDYVQGYILTYSKVVPADDLISEYNEIEVFHNGDDATISNLDTDTEYVFSIKVNTIQGPGKSSKPLICRTSESLPEAPAGLKSMLLSPNMALISWLPPKQPNGQIQHYTLYEREKINGMQGAVKSQSFEPHVRQIQLSMFRHSSSYLWWITATNGVGESDKSRTASLSTVKSGGMPAAIANFHGKIQTKWHANIDLPCTTSGIPTPNVKWTFNSQPIDLLHSQRLVYDNFTLHLDSVTSTDSGNYTCTAWNVYGSENVTTSLLVVEPPKPPILGIVNVSWTNVTVNWTKAPNTYAVQQYLLSYKYINEPENMYTEISLPSHSNVFTLPNIKCGTTIAFSISASNRVGHGMQSRPFNVKTLQGKTPIAPTQNEAIEQMVSGFLIHLQKWNSKYCPITHFSVYKRLTTEKEWTTVNENITPNGIYSIETLSPSTNYNILIKCYNSAGMTSTMYTASTLTNYGGNYDNEALSVNDKIMLTIYNIAVMWPLAVALLLLIVISLSLIVCYKYRHMYKKNQRHLEANNMILKNNSCSKSEIHSDAYETCTPFKSKSTILTNDDSNYNEISPYATFQISPSKSPKRNKQYFCTNCAPPHWSAVFVDCLSPSPNRIELVPDRRRVFIIFREMGKVESATRKSNNSGSLWDFIRVEFKRGYSLENDEKEFSDRREKVYTFMKIPLEVERFMFYGFCQCADSFLFVYTFLPLRALVALKSLICSSFSKFKDKHKKKRLSAAETCDLLKMAVLITCSMMLLPWDTSMMYHVIKSQSVIKLYIFFNMLEVGDRLFSSFGQDILDALFWTATEPKTSRREHFGVLPHFIMAVFYVFLHGILVLCQATTLNVAINSSHKALLAIMMSNNFVELKGSVFKKFDKTNLFQLSCSDVRERFHLFILLLIVVVQTMKEYQWTSESFWELMLDCMYVMISEMLIDWTKHAFITRFNEINLSVYSDYVLSFAYDTAQSRHTKAFTDHSDLVARRMGFIPIPLGVVMIKVLTRCVSIDGRLASIILLFFTFTCLVTLKIVNLVYILGRACKLIDLHKTSLIKNHHIINGISCQDMATSPMRPPIRKKQSWSDNKENKPSPLIEVPPLGPIPMFANSNVDIKEACLNTQILEDIVESDLTHSDSDLNLSMVRDADTLSTKSA